MSRGAGTVDDPITDPSGLKSWADLICRCGVCGYTAACTPDDDFARRPGESILRCKEHGAPP